MKSYREVFSTGVKPALIPFLVLGDPDVERSLDIIKTAIDAGADILELGIPFSDPIADGPTIQRADVRALEAGMNCRRALEMIGQIRAYSDVPIGLLLYYNLICRYGIEAFYREAGQAGVNSVLVADLGVDDAGEVQREIEANQLDTVYMVTVNTSRDRRKKIVKLCTGFIYAVSVLGVTGARQNLGSLVKPLIKTLKQETKVPVSVGFGVSRAEQVREMTQAGADGVIVGSALIDILEKNMGDERLCLQAVASYIKQLKRVCRG